MPSFLLSISCSMMGLQSLFPLFMVFLCVLVLGQGSGYRPVVLLHGVLTGSGSMQMIAERIKEKHPGTIIYNVDRFEGWSSLENMWHQVLEIGQDIANFSSKYPDGVNFIGYSQGGLLGRAILQTFGNHSVHTFISLSSPQAGQYGVGFLRLLFPNLAKETAFELFYSRVGQHNSVANYWNDPYHQTLFTKYCVFLPYINNLIKSNQSEEFKRNLLKLKRLVLIGGPDDNVITPWQSSQFGFYNGNETVIMMKWQPVYTDDLIGLQTLDRRKRLHVVTAEGVNHFNWHMNVSVVDNYLLPYLD